MDRRLNPRRYQMRQDRIRDLVDRALQGRGALNRRKCLVCGVNRRNAASWLTLVHYLGEISTKRPTPLSDRRGVWDACGRHWKNVRRAFLWYCGNHQGSTGKNLRPNPFTLVREPTVSAVAWYVRHRCPGNKRTHWAPRGCGPV